MLTFGGFVTEAGTFKLDDPIAFREQILPLSGSEVIITIKRKTYRRGNQQLRYLRGVVIPDIARACGYSDPDDWFDVYDGLMWKFFRLPDGQFGQPRRESCAKKTMTTERLSEVIDTLITYAESSIPGCTVRRAEDVDMREVYDPPYDEAA